MKEDVVIKNISDMEKEAVENACNSLNAYTRNIRDYLSVIVASLCDVELEDLLVDTKHMGSIQARRLYWYAYQQLTHETCEAISRKTCKGKFTTACVVTAILKISMLIQSGTIWTKRWSILKRIINSTNSVKQQEMFPPNVTVKITQPQGVNIEIKKE